MDDVRGDFFGPPHGTTPAAVIANKIKTISAGNTELTFIDRHNCHYLCTFSLAHVRTG